MIDSESLGEIIECIKTIQGVNVKNSSKGRSQDMELRVLLVASCDPKRANITYHQSLTTIQEEIDSGWLDLTVHT